jgi:hypothetical protein
MQAENLIVSDTIELWRSSDESVPETSLECAGLAGFA